jgi:hypothetical protein
MFDSGIPVKDLIEELNTEVDVALDIPDKTYVSWLNSLQQLIYTEIIKEQKKITVEKPESNVITLPKVSGENQPRFEDVHTIYVGDKQLKKTTLASGNIFPDTFCKVNNDIWISTFSPNKNVDVIYFVKPELIPDNVGDSNVMIPIEFIDLVKAKLRGEAYKLANEGDLAAMWLNDYNTLLETFKAWIAEKSATFGM